MKPAEKSTDDALRDSLDAHAGDDYDRALLGEPKKDDARAGDRAKDDSESKVKRELGPASQKEDPQENLLVSAAQGMRDAQDRLAQGKSDAITQHVQRQAVSDLEKLIEQVKKSGKCCGQSLCNNPKPSSKPGGSPKPGAQANAKQPARDSSPNAKHDPSPSRGAADEAVLRMMREQYRIGLQAHPHETMLEGPSEYFLPEYRREIEDYFRRLSSGKPMEERP